MIAAAPDLAAAEQGPVSDGYAKALVNILDDFAEERSRLAHTQSAIFNIAEDFNEEKRRLEATQKAIMNILEDSRAEKLQLEAAQKAAVNILDDSAAERDHLHMAQKAVFNILDDLQVEKSHIEDAQKDLLRSEHNLRASLREKEAMLKEIHHRVKNNLQVISSLLSLQSEHLRDLDALRMFEESQGRIRSMALVHEKLYESKDLSHVSFDEYVRALVSDVCHGFNAEPRGIAVRIAVNDVRLAIDTAIPCGLIVNELVTNALKHAFPVGRRGFIDISLRRHEAGELELLVADDGIGFSDEMDPQKSGSFGLDLVFTFAEQLAAKVEVRRGGGAALSFKFRGDV